MTITKKLLAVLLAGLMLVGFGVGAAALTPEEELVAEGRALLMQAMEDLRGDYSFGRGTVHSNGNYALDLGDGTRELHLGDKIYRVFPDRKAYQQLKSSSETPWLRMLEPKVITEETPISIKISVSGAVEGSYKMEVYFDGLRYGFSRQTGSLVEISHDGLGDMLINRFRKEADLSLFSLDGMREANALQVWLWDFPQGFRFDRNSVFANIFGGFLDMMLHAPFLLPFFILILPFAPLILLLEKMGLLFR